MLYSLLKHCSNACKLNDPRPEFPIFLFFTIIRLTKNNEAYRLPRVGINNSVNAAPLAIRFLGAFITAFHEKMKIYQIQIEKQVEDKLVS